MQQLFLKTNMYFRAGKVLILKLFVNVFSMRFLMKFGMYLKPVEALPCPLPFL